MSHPLTKHVVILLTFQHFFVSIHSILSYFPHLIIISDITCRPLRACRPRQRRRAASSWWGGCPRSPSRGGPGCCTSRHTAASRTGHTANYHSCLLHYNFMPCRSSQTHGKLLWHIVMQHWSNVPHQCTDCILYWRSKLAMISTQTIMYVSNLVFLIQKYCLCVFWLQDNVSTVMVAVECGQFLTWHWLWAGLGIMVRYKCLEGWREGTGLYWAYSCPLQFTKIRIIQEPSQTVW